MKVLLICGSLPPARCGVGDYTHTLANAMFDIGIDVSVMTSVEMNPQFAKYKVLNCITQWGGKTLLKEIDEYLKGEYDIVHFELPFLALKRENVFSVFGLPYILRKYSKKLVCTLHEYSGKGWKRFLRKLECFPIISLSDAVFVVEPKFRTEISMIFKNKNIYFVQIHANVHKTSASDLELKTLYDGLIKNNPQVDNVISSFGFVASNKKVDVVLEALNILKNKGELKSIFVICGELDSTVEKVKEYQDRLKQYIIDNELSDYVYITGYLKEQEVGKYLKASDMAVLLYEEGASVRHGACLAVLQEGVQLITSGKQNQELFSTDDIPQGQIILVENDPVKLSQQLIKLQGNRNTYIVSDNVFSPLATAEKHRDLYEKILGER